MWAKIFLREHALNNILPEADEIYLGEDCLFTFSNIINASCVVVCNEYKGYHYIEYENSITHSYRKAYFHDIDILYDTLKKMTANINTKAIEKAIAYNYVFLFFGGILQEIGRGNKINYIEKYKNISLFCKGHRFKESIKKVDIEKLPDNIRGYVELWAKNKTLVFMVKYLISVVIKRIF